MRRRRLVDVSLGSGERGVYWLLPGVACPRDSTVTRFEAVDGAARQIVPEATLRALHPAPDMPAAASPSDQPPVGLRPSNKHIKRARGCSSAGVCGASSVRARCPGAACTFGGDASRAADGCGLAGSPGAVSGEETGASLSSMQLWKF
jgi:hypothetical protein